MKYAYAQLFITEWLVIVKGFKESKHPPIGDHFIRPAHPYNGVTKRNEEQYSTKVNFYESA